MSKKFADEFENEGLPREMEIEDREVIGYCEYCHCEIYKGDKVIVKNGNMYHYDPYNVTDRCYFEEDEQIEEEI